MSNRNRTAGNKFELYCTKLFEQIVGKTVRTTRLASRLEDANKLDLLSWDTYPYQVQCKLTAKIPPLDDLKNMKGMGYINLIIWGKTKRKEKNMVKEGDYVIMRWEDFESMAEYYIAERHKEDERETN